MGQRVWHGFIVSTSVGEAGCANEFHGFRMAAGSGSEQVREKFTPNVVNFNYEAAGGVAALARG